MVSTKLMVVLLVFYAAILVASLIERHWWRACYWTGAIILMIGVLGMSAKCKDGNP